MSNLFDKPNAELRALKAQSEEVLHAMMQTLRSRMDMREVIHRLMTPDDTLEAFSQIGVEDPDLARVTLEAAVAALVNTQSVLAIDAELKHRASRN